MRPRPAGFVSECIQARPLHIAMPFYALCDTYEIRRHGFLCPPTEPSPLRANNHSTQGNATMSHNNTVLYTGKTTTTGGREGHSHSSDSRLDITLSRTQLPRYRHQSGTAVRLGLVRLLHRCHEPRCPGIGRTPSRRRFGRRRGGPRLQSRRRLLPAGSPQRKPAWIGSHSCAVDRRPRSSALPVFQGDARKYPCRRHCGVSRAHDFNTILNERRQP